MSKKKKHRKGNKVKIGKSAIRRGVIEYLQANSTKSYNYKQIAAQVGVKDTQNRQMILQILKQLKANGELKEPEIGMYQWAQLSPKITGKLQTNLNGSAYVISEQTDQDIYIPPKYVGSAMDGDTVEIFLFARSRRRKPEGQVVEIVQRARTQFVGVLQIDENFAFLIPDNKRIHDDIYVPIKSIGKAQNGQKVVVEITKWPDRYNGPKGKVVDILGNVGENDAEMGSILIDYGFEPKFPQKVEEEAAALPFEITQEEIAKRLDLRDTLTFTIDPFDAKDFDDAISFEALENGHFKIGVHIADVTHYVQPGTALEEEAQKRATSVYLVDRVIPMLPEVLSNKVCSLRPNEDKLTFSCIFEMNEKAEVINHWIGRTVIHSNRRFTYEEAQERIESKEGDLSTEINLINDLAKVLRASRMKNGAIAFDRVEVRFKLDEEKKPAGVIFKIQKDAHKLIEEFMLMANRTVATEFGKSTPDKQGKTFVYRVHDLPDPEKLSEFGQFIHRFGYRFDFTNPNKTSQNLNKFLAEVKDKPESNMLETLAVRTMAKAEYSTHNIGHYGLAFPFYSHFTSPIRRYPDMMAHRLIAEYLAGGKSAEEGYLEALCKHSSAMERRAAEAERESTKYFQVLMMEEHVGEVFDGVISGVTEWGIYVELDVNKCEGMIRLKEMGGDYYVYDDENHRVIGHNNGNVYALGQAVKIKITKADLANRRMDFELAE